MGNWTEMVGTLVEAFIELWSKNENYKIFKSISNYLKVESRTHYLNGYSIPTNKSKSILTNFE